MTNGMRTLPSTCYQMLGDQNPAVAPVSRDPGCRYCRVVDELLDADLDPADLGEDLVGGAVQVKGLASVFQCATWSRMRTMRALASSDPGRIYRADSVDHELGQR
jgi:hypothetical protein